MIPKTKAEQLRYLEGVSRTKWGDERDSQRSRLYKAERDITIPNGNYLSSVQDIQNYVDKIINSAWWRNRFSLKQIIVKGGRTGCSACGYLLRRSKIGIIKMPHWSRYELWILHEIAHTVVDRPYAPHGRLFAKIYLELVRHKMKSAAHKALKGSYQKYNVKFYARRILR